MGKFTLCVLLLEVVGYLLQETMSERQCSTSGESGISGCECNIMEACDEHGNPRSNWAQYLPANVEQFGLVKGRQRNLAYLCERETVAILYDCNNRIPLYAATVITGKQLTDRSIPRKSIKKYFRRSEKRNQLDISFQQNNARKIWYKLTTIDELRGLSSSGVLVVSVGPEGATWLKTELNKGHLIASQYGRANRTRMEATFTYTNTVPQFGPFNQGPWQQFETRLIKWGQDYCAVRGAQNVQMFVVVGAVPSTNMHIWQQKIRYFGTMGLSGFKRKRTDRVVVDHYPVNVPSYMWTAACCKYQVKGTWKYHNTAFYRENHPRKSPCENADVDTLTWWLSRWVRFEIELFPHSSQCKNDSNFVPLP